MAFTCGLLIALFYDVYWLLIAYRRRPLALRTIQDLLFWLAVFCVITALWLYFTGGVMRLAVYLWLILGMVVFRCSLSRPLRRLRPRLKLPSAVLAPKSTILRDSHVASRGYAKGKSLIDAAMLQTGLGFWRATNWFAQQGRQGGAWLAARLPKRKTPPEEGDLSAEGTSPEQGMEQSAALDEAPPQQGKKRRHKRPRGKKTQSNKPRSNKPRSKKPRSKNRRRP